MKNILILSSSLLTDRIIYYSLLPSLRLCDASTKVWTTSTYRTISSYQWDNHLFQTQSIPPIFPFKEFPYNYLRRFNELSWDYHLQPPSRLSILQHIRNRNMSWRIKALKIPAYILSLTKCIQFFENILEKILLNYNRSPQARNLLTKYTPSIVVSTGPHRYTEPAIIAEAKKLGIPVLAYMTSWDNISTKNRMMFQYDGYLLWSEQMKNELNIFYPLSSKKPSYIIGAPQYDVFFDHNYWLSREEFCQAHNLHSNKPIILYSLGSPNFLQEYHGALHLAKCITNGMLGEAQLLIRPHPLFETESDATLFHNLGPRVFMQNTGQAGRTLTERTQDENQIKDWINTFRHADVVINLSSTVTIDAAIFDKPVVNLDFDPEPGRPNQELVKDVNHKWTHFKPIAESGGIWLVNNYEEMIKAVTTYLRHPELHREKRRWVAEYVCGYLDGKCGERMAAAILEFLENQDRQAN